MPDLSQRIVYQVDGMDRVNVERSLCYKRLPGEDSALHMDVYTPPGLRPDARLPAVFFVHGGPIPTDMLAPTTWGIFQSYGALLAASGIIGVTFNHRLHSLTDYGRSQTDIVDAIAYVRDNADALRIDAERIGLWVFSGGGPQLSWALRERPSYLRCAAAFYALLDVTHLTPPGADSSLVASARELSPITYLKRPGRSFPLFVARAGLDSATINHSIDGFVQEAVATNTPLDFMNHPTGLHAFDGLNDEERSRDIIRAAVTFMHTHL